MKWRPRSRQADPSIAEDGLDDRLWEYVCDQIVAAHTNDIVTFRALAKRMSDYVKRPDVHSEPGIWLLYLLQQQVAAMLGHQPTLAELEELTDRYQDAYRKIIYRRVRLIGVLATACELSTEETEIVGTDFWVGAIVALGVLLDDPRPSLAEMRPSLAVWYRDVMQQYFS